jgi:protein phosphatase
MPTLRLQMAARSDTGQVRAHNEDICLAEQVMLPDGKQATLLLVADGMGGEQAGEAASRLASSTVRETLQKKLQQQQPTWDDSWHTLLHECVQAANRQVYEQATRHASYSGMGTTLTLLLVVGSRAHLAHAGDSRAYLLHAEGVADDGLPWLQLTSDHSLVARLVDIGQLDAEEARRHPQRNMIYRALGKQPTIEADTSSQPLGVGDHLLLCSDGLTAHVSDEELAHIALAAPDPAHACEQLIRLANQRGGSDNISVVIAMVEGVEGIDHHVRL